MNRRTNNKTITFFHLFDNYVNSIFSKNTFSKFVLTAHTTAHTAANRIMTDKKYFCFDVFLLKCLFHFRECAESTSVRMWTSI